MDWMGRERRRRRYGCGHGSHRVLGFSTFLILGWGVGLFRLLLLRSFLTFLGLCMTCTEDCISVYDTKEQRYMGIGLEDKLGMHMGDHNCFCSLYNFTLTASSCCAFFPSFSRIRW